MPKGEDFRFHCQRCLHECVDIVPPQRFLSNNAEIDYSIVEVLMEDNVVKSEINNLFIIM